MIGKFLILVGLIPFLGSLVVRKLGGGFYLKQSENGEKFGISGEELASQLLQKGGGGDVEVVVRDRVFEKADIDRLVLSGRQAKGEDGRSLAEVCLRVGMVLMARREQKVMAWRAWALKFSWAFPVFALVAAIFALLVGKGTLGVGLAVASLGVSSILLWLTLGPERAGARIVAEWVEESAVMRRRDDGERLGKMVRSLVWTRVVPRALWFL